MPTWVRVQPIYNTPEALERSSMYLERVLERFMVPLMSKLIRQQEGVY